MLPPPGSKRKGFNDGPPKKKPLLPTDVKEYLTKWCLDNLDSPYPNEREKQDLCAATNLTLTQVNNWCAACDAPTKKPARHIDPPRATALFPMPTSAHSVARRT